MNSDLTTPTIEGTSVEATDEVFVHVYSELKSISGSYFKNERSNHTLQPTAVVHEAYLRLAKISPGEWQDRRKFVAVASRAMRRILVDHARKKRANKRHADTIELDPGVMGQEGVTVDLVGLNDALDQLTNHDPQRGQIVELHFFGGLTVGETAKALGVGERTVYRKLRSAKAWLRLQLLDESKPSNKTNE